MKTPLVAANWKMHKTVRETLSYAHSIRDRMPTVNDVEVVVAPPFTALHALAGVEKDNSEKIRILVVRSVFIVRLTFFKVG